MNELPKFRVGDHEFDIEKTQLNTFKQHIL